MSTPVSGPAWTHINWSGRAAADGLAGDVGLDGGDRVAERLDLRDGEAVGHPARDDVVAVALRREEQRRAGLTRAEARIVGPTDFGFVWVVSSEEPGLVGRLAANGAIGAYRELPVSPTLAGCFALADAKVSQAFQ